MVGTTRAELNIEDIMQVADAAALSSIEQKGIVILEGTLNPGVYFHTDLDLSAKIDSPNVLSFGFGYWVKVADYGLDEDIRLVKRVTDLETLNAAIQVELDDKLSKDAARNPMTLEKLLEGTDPEAKMVTAVLLKQYLNPDYSWLYDPSDTTKDDPFTPPALNSLTFTQDSYNSNTVGLLSWHHTDWSTIIAYNVKIEDRATGRLITSFPVNVPSQSIVLPNTFADGLYTVSVNTRTKVAESAYVSQDFTLLAPTSGNALNLALAGGSWNSEDLIVGWSESTIINFIKYLVIVKDVNGYPVATTDTTDLTYTFPLSLNQTVGSIRACTIEVYQIYTVDGSQVTSDATSISAVNAVPTTPSGLIFDSVANRIYVKWATPDSDVERTTLYYRIANGPWVTKSVSKVAVGILISELPNTTTFECKLVHEDALGESAYSVITTVATTAPVAPTAVVLTPGFNSVSVKLTVTDRHAGTRFWITEVDGEIDLLNPVFEDEAISFTVQGLNVGKAYDIHYAGLDELFEHGEINTTQFNTLEVPIEGLAGLSDWASEENELDTQWVIDVLKGEEIPSTRIENLTVAKLTAGVLNATIQLSTDGVIKTTHEDSGYESILGIHGFAGNSTIYTMSNRRISDGDLISGFTADGILFAKGAEISGKVTIESGSSGYSAFSDKPTSLGDVNNTEGSKLTGISNNADVTDYPGINQSAQDKADAAKAAAVQEAEAYVNSNFVDNVSYDTDIQEIRDQIDNSITTWFDDGEPTLSSAPANGWSTDEDKDVHLGDLYYDNDTGYAYRFKKQSTTYSWLKLADSDVTKALADAATAQDTADGKRRVFFATPVAPYDRGDLWDTGSGLKRADTASTTTYSSGHWIFITDAYGDANAARIAAINTAATAAQTKADLAEQLSKAYADEIVTAEEQRAIDDAQTKANAAQTAAIIAASIDASTKANAAIEASLLVELISNSNMETIGTTTKKIGSNSWNAQTYSKQSFLGGAAISCVIAVKNGSIAMLGLTTDPTTDVSYTSIDYAIYIQETTYRVYEFGVYKGVILNEEPQVGDVLSVQYDGVNVRYLINGVVYRTLGVAADLKLFFDSSFNTTGGAIKNIQFGPLTNIKPAIDVAAADATAKANAAQTAATNAAQTKADLAKTEANAYADGIVTAEEQRAIDDATIKADAAQNAAILASEISTGVYSRYYVASNSNYKPILGVTGGSLPTKHNNSSNLDSIFRLTATTGGTSTVTKLVGDLYYDGSAWIWNVISTLGTSNNHPRVLIQGGIPTISTWHGNNYTLLVTLENMYVTSRAEDIAVAQANAELAIVTAAAYADGIVTLEEARAISDASTKANAAQAAAVIAAGILADEAVENSSSINIVTTGPMLAKGNSLKRAGGTPGDWQSQGYSVNYYVGGVSLSFEISEGNTGAIRFMVGLNTDPTTNNNYNTIDYAFYPANNQYVAYESSSNVAILSTATPVVGDVLTLDYDGVNVRYYINGVIKRTTPAAANLKFYMDSSFTNSHAGVKNINFTPIANIKNANDYALTTTKTIIDGGLITTGGITLDGTGGYLRAGKTSFTDMSNNGLWLGQTSQGAAINLGNANDYFYFRQDTGLRLKTTDLEIGDGGVASFNGSIYGSENNFQVPRLMDVTIPWTVGDDPFAVCSINVPLKAHTGLFISAIAANGRAIDAKSIGDTVLKIESEAAYNANRPAIDVKTSAAAHMRMASINYIPYGEAGDIAMVKVETTYVPASGVTTQTFEDKLFYCYLSTSDSKGWWRMIGGRMIAGRGEQFAGGTLPKDRTTEYVPFGQKGDIKAVGKSDGSTNFACCYESTSDAKGLWANALLIGTMDGGSSTDINVPGKIEFGTVNLGGNSSTVVVLPKTVLIAFSSTRWKGGDEGDGSSIRWSNNTVSIRNSYGSSQTIMYLAITI